MSGGIEAAGDAITGGLVARAVEPQHGESAGEAAGSCLNCGMGLIGNHCHNCGQSAQVHRTLMAFWHDFTHSILHFEGKIWRTLPLLVFRPGVLTRRYVHGERARFVSPLALFLFSVFLMFAVFSLVGMPFGTVNGNSEKDIVTARAGVSKELSKARERLATLEKSGAPRSQIDSAREDVVGLETAVTISEGFGPKGFRLDKAKVDTGSPQFDQAVDHAIRNPALLAYKMQSNAYKFSWALIPISIPFVWLLFVFRRQYKPYDHAIFVTYSLCFIGLLLVFASFLGKLGPVAGLRGPLLVLAPPVHMFAQLRGAYQLGIFSAAWRTVALLGIAFFVLLVFGLMLLMMGVSA